MYQPDLNEYCQSGMPFDHSVEYIAAAANPPVNIGSAGLPSAQLQLRVRLDILVRGVYVLAYDANGQETLSFFMNISSSRDDSRWVTTDPPGGVVPASLIAGTMGEPLLYPAPKLLRQGDFINVFVTPPPGTEIKYFNLTLLAVMLQTDRYGRTRDPMIKWDRRDLGYQAIAYKRVTLVPVAESGVPGNEHFTDYVVGTKPYDILMFWPRTLHVDDSQPDKTLPLIGANSLLQFRDNESGHNLNIRRIPSNAYAVNTQQIGVNQALIVRPQGGEFAGCWHIRNDTTVELQATPIAGPNAGNPILFYCVMHGERIPVAGLPGSASEAQQAQELQQRMQAAGHPAAGGPPAPVEHVLQNMLQRRPRGG